MCRACNVANGRLPFCQCRGFGFGWLIILVAGVAFADVILRSAFVETDKGADGFDWLELETLLKSGDLLELAFVKFKGLDYLFVFGWVGNEP